MSKVNGMQGCSCIEWQTAMQEIVAVFIKADELGIKYHGGAFKYCPYCGSSLIEINNFQSGKNLFFDGKLK